MVGVVAAAVTVGAQLALVQMAGLHLAEVDLHSLAVPM